MGDGLIFSLARLHWLFVAVGHFNQMYTQLTSPYNFFIKIIFAVLYEISVGRITNQFDSIYVIRL